MLPYNKLEAIYDELSGLGLYVVPKGRNIKFPVPKYWSKSQKVHCDRETALKEQQSDSVSGWCVITGHSSNRLIVLDFDPNEIKKYGEEPKEVLRRVRRLSPNGFMITTPTNGVHLYYCLPEDFKMIGNISPPVQGVDLRAEGGQVLTLGSYYVYIGADAQKKGVSDGHLGYYDKVADGDYSHIPMMTADLYEWLTSKPDHRGENYAETKLGHARVEEHARRNMDEKVSLTLECLSHILAEWDEDSDYERWYQLWMAAHHASDGSKLIRDFILTHPSVYWHDGDKGRKHFVKAWDTYKTIEGGYTSSSLFWMARQAGWLERTGYEIPEKRAELINVRYVGDWFSLLEDIPKRLLLQSQTGSGKTYNIKQLWDKIGQSKAVVFVPSIKLASELANTLRRDHDIPATLYRDTVTGSILEADDLFDAHFLVTTLQTFGKRVFDRGANMSDYGLVYIEESDQLLAQFARGGGGDYHSHVKEAESRLGFAVLRAAMADSEYVWCVDATMSKVTYDAATWLNETIEVVQNRYVFQKSPVEFVEEKMEAYQLALDSLLRGERVVISCDTRADATEIYEIMFNVGGLANKNVLLITGATERHPEVRNFMANINNLAEEYDLVVYNSVMASGVSVVSVSPDLVIQISRYLTPRTNLQMLNRYRKQKRVICWYLYSESLYSDRSKSILERAAERAKLESLLANMPLVDRSSDAKLRGHIASVSVADDTAQQRSPREFYQSLLRMDGREVFNIEKSPVSMDLSYSLLGVQTIKKTKEKLIARQWRSVPPIDEDRPAKAEYTDLEVALGEAHAHIERVLIGKIPEDEDDEIIYDTVKEFDQHGYVLSMYVSQLEAYASSERNLTHEDKSLTSMNNLITRFYMVTMINVLYQTIDDKLSSEVLLRKGDNFLKMLEFNQDKYDLVVGKNHRYNVIIHKYEEDKEKLIATFSKVLLNLIGLKQRSKRGSRAGGQKSREYYIANKEEARRYLTWKGKADILFTIDPIRLLIEQLEAGQAIYDEMNDLQKSGVLRLTTGDFSVDFGEAIEIVAKGLTW